MAGNASKYDLAENVQKLKEDPEDLHLLIQVLG